MPKSPKNPSEPSSNPKIDVDKGVGDEQLEDRVGRRPDEKPDMVPPGQTVGHPDVDPDDAGSKQGPLDPDAIEADRATARQSDRLDARDGVDASDSLPSDPDTLGGRRRS